MLIQSSLYLIFFLFSLGQIGRVSFFGQQVNLYLYEIVLVLSLVILFTKYQFKPLIYVFQKFKVIYIFLAILVLSLVVGFTGYSQIVNLMGFLYLVRIASYFLYFFYFLYHLKIENKFNQTLKRAIGLFAVFTIIITLVQYFFYPDLRNLIYLGWDPHLYRLFGVFFDSFVAAAVFGLLFFYYFFRIKGNFKYLFTIIFFIFLIMTFSRMAYLSFLIAFISFLIFKKSYKKVFLTVSAFLVILVLIPKPFGEGVNLTRIFSIESRMNEYKSALKLIEKKPILGVGYDRIRYEKLKVGLIDQKDWQTTHAGSAFPSFLTILAASGAIGLVAFIFVLYDLAKFSLAAKVYLIFLSLFSLSDNALLHPFILFLLINLLVVEYKFKIRSSNKAVSFLRKPSLTRRKQESMDPASLLRMKLRKGTASAG